MHQTIRTLDKEKHYKVASICRLFGVSRQAYYQHKEPDFEKQVMYCFTLEYVREVRREAPRMGCQKLYVKCKRNFGEQFAMGRDAFYRLLRENGLMLAVKKSRCRTTFGQKTGYTNLAAGFIPLKINQLWVADITYIRIGDGKFCYLSLVTDAYSHKIIGWVLAPRMEFHYTQEALEMAINAAKGPLQGLIHHSDRGFQYNYTAYTDLLRQHKIRISMTQGGNPRENAVAERANGILKQEWLGLHDFKNIEEVRQVLEPAIEFYNTKRPHASIDFLTPEEAEKRTGALKKHWKNYYPVKPDFAQVEETNSQAG